ncbi:rRNA methyltransferase [Effusibacillus dendaii]|uniref:rRNA methyltransferase n=2 Tax=Effusibacillus dendaii TaxID=2743772 RepID=A0A7I8DE27_9BACL|nr:class I SAM-dependent methyltransferase [Effusibacillus dendaii]BCJ86770.1 rRNA methyltransferase [Effusibacillus dendaii]
MGGRGESIPDNDGQISMQERNRRILAVDATVGNGHDTLFLAECVGANGLVYGFDIQSAAIEAASNRLSDARLLQRVVLLEAGHERLAEMLPQDTKGNLQAVMFNLGYLPGGDKSVITRADTTVRALQTALEWLAPQGVITCVIYPGHPGGAEESDRVLQWARTVDQRQAQVLWYRFLNQQNRPPTLLAISRNG